MPIVRTALDLDSALVDDLDELANQLGESRATVLRLVLRCGLDELPNRLGLRRAPVDVFAPVSRDSIRGALKQFGRTFQEQKRGFVLDGGLMLTQRGVAWFVVRPGGRPRGVRKLLDLFAELTASATSEVPRVAKPAAKVSDEQVEVDTALFDRRV